MKTAEEYLESLRQLKLRVYFFGQRIESPSDFQLTKPSQNAVALTYALAQDPEYSDLMTATSHLTGEKVNRFTHIPQNSDDLVKKVKMLRLLGQKTGGMVPVEGWTLSRINQSMKSLKASSSLKPVEL